MRLDSGGLLSDIGEEHGAGFQDDVDDGNLLSIGNKLGAKMNGTSE